MRTKKYNKTASMYAEKLRKLGYTVRFNMKTYYLLRKQVQMQNWCASLDGQYTPKELILWAVGVIVLLSIIIISQ